MVNDGTNFSEAVVSWSAAWLEGAIVHKVDISGDLQKAVSWYAVCNGTIVEVVILLPVVLDCWELVDLHENGEHQKGLHLFYGDLRPLGKLFTSHDVFSVPITFSHHQRHQLISEEDLKDLSGTAVVGPTGEMNDFTSTGFSIVVMEKRNWMKQVEVSFGVRVEAMERVEAAAAVKQLTA